MNRTAQIILLTLASLLAVMPGGHTAAADERSLEYPAKAAIVYHTVQFTEWPAAAFADPKAPIVVGLVGTDIFKGALESAVKDRSAWGRPLVFRHFASADKIEPCQVLVVSPSEKDRLAAVLDRVRGKHTLTISDADNFITAGGMMRLMILDNKPRFEIRLKAAEQAGLKISSKLLKLAAKVYQD
jgi:hypothetical protein